MAITTENNKNLFTIIGCIIVSTVLQGFLTKTSNVPEQLAVISTNIGHIQQQLPRFATNDNLDSVSDEVNDIKTRIQKYATSKELQMLDDRFKNEKSLNELQHLRYQKRLDDTDRDVSDLRKKNK